MDFPSSLRAAAYHYSPRQGDERGGQKRRRLSPSRRTPSDSGRGAYNSSLDGDTHESPQQPFVDRWGEFDQYAERSPSPPPTPPLQRAAAAAAAAASGAPARLQLIGSSQALAAHDLQGGGAKSERSSLSSVRSRSLASDSGVKFASGSKEPTHVQEAPQPVSADAQKSTPIAMPKFEQTQKGKTWPLHYELAFVRYLAYDPALRSAVVWGTSGGVGPAMQRWSDQTQGPAGPTLRRKLNRYYETYKDFRAGISPAGLAAPTSEWKSDVDFGWLQTCESGAHNKWISTLHNSIYMHFPRQPMLVPPHDLHLPVLLPAAADTAVAGPSQAAAVSDRKPAKSDATPAVAGPSTTTAPPARERRVRKSAMSQAEAQLYNLQTQMDDQADQIALLQAQSEEQTRTLAKQAELLQQQARVAEMAEQRAQTQAQKAQKQTEMLERVERQLAAYCEMVGERA